MRGNWKGSYLQWSKAGALLGRLAFLHLNITMMHITFRCTSGSTRLDSVLFHGKREFLSQNAHR